MSAVLMSVMNRFVSGGIDLDPCSPERSGESGSADCGRTLIGNAEKQQTGR